MSTQLVSVVWPHLVASAIQGFILLALAALVTLALRKSSAALRHLTWASAMGATLLLPMASPMISWFMPHWHVTEPKALVEFTSPVIVESSSPATTSGVAASSPDAPSHALESHGNWKAYVEVAVLCGIVLRIGTFGFAMLGLWRIGRNSQRASSDNWRNLMRDVSNQLNLRQPATLLISRRGIMPMTWGVLRPKVLLPGSASDWPEQRRRIVLMHELAHVKRLDCLAQLVCQLSLAVYWFNPLAWLAQRRVVIERERACDDMVLAQGAPPSEYAEQLLAALREFSSLATSRAAAIGMARPSNVMARMKAILEPRPRLRKITTWQACAASAAAIALLLPLAALRAQDKPAIAPPQIATTAPSNSGGPSYAPPNYAPSSSLPSNNAPLNNAPSNNGFVVMGFMGRTVPSADVNVRARVDGPIVKVDFKEGQNVVAGELLMQIDPSPYQAILHQAQAQLEKDRAVLKAAQKELVIYKDGHAMGLYTQAELATKEAPVEEGQAGLDRDQGEVEAAELNVSYCSIRSPIDGRIGLRSVDAGNMVRAADATWLASIVQLDPMMVEFYLPADQIAAVLKSPNGGIGLSVKVVSGDGRTPLGSGSIVAMDNHVDERSGDLTVKARLANPDGSILPGQMVQVLLNPDQTAQTVGR